LTIEAGLSYDVDWKW